MKIEYCVLKGDFAEPDAEVLDTITWDDGQAPTYDTGKARTLVTARIAVLGAKRTRDLLAAGWSNGYVSTRAV